jgi:hypothetical protein
MVGYPVDQNSDNIRPAPVRRRFQILFKRRALRRRKQPCVVDNVFAAGIRANSRRKDNDSRKNGDRQTF